MKNNFQLILLIVFIVAAVFGLLVFSGLIPIGSNNNAVVTGSVVLWGTESSSALAAPLENFSKANPTLVIRYVQKDPATFDQNLLEALAAGTGPDTFILPDDLIVHYKNKITPIPFTSMPQATFQNTFASAGQIYVNSAGILALPLAIDPLVMYYNRSMFDANGIVNPPATWDDVQSLVPLLTKKDKDNKLTSSAVALGQYVNVAHAKDLVSMLFMQAGNPIIRESGGFLASTLGGTGTTASAPLGPVLSFYTNFADPLNPLYSWNRSLQNSIDAFSAEKLAIYFGYASELSTLSAKNPNENFYVAPMPQIKNSNFKVTFGHTYGIAISSSTKSPTVAFTVAGILANGPFAGEFANALLIAPARRDLLAAKPTDAYFPIFYNSALFAKTWLDPLPTDTNDIFKNMVENVLSNNLSADSSVLDASNKLELLLSQ